MKNHIDHVPLAQSSRRLRRRDDPRRTAIFISGGARAGLELLRHWGATIRLNACSFFSILHLLYLNPFHVLVLPLPFHCACCSLFRLCQPLSLSLASFSFLSSSLSAFFPSFLLFLFPFYSFCLAPSSLPFR